MFRLKDSCKAAIKHNLPKIRERMLRELCTYCNLAYMETDKAIKHNSRNKMKTIKNNVNI